jgi:hypothetical protein
VPTNAGTPISLNISYSSDYGTNVVDIRSLLENGVPDPGYQSREWKRIEFGLQDSPPYFDVLRMSSVHLRKMYDMLSDAQNALETISELDSSSESLEDFFNYYAPK